MKGRRSCALFPDNAECPCCVVLLSVLSVMPEGGQGRVVALV